MKRAAIIHYTDRGARTAAQIAELLSDGYEVEQYRSRCNMENVFHAVDALIFVGAAGIAVRTIAPHLRSKTTDPAVIVTDERGLHVISLISGHIGGANALTRQIAAAIGGHPVITTATDVSGRFAVDEWAARQGLKISSMQMAKQFAVEILRRDLPLASDFQIRGELPGGLIMGNEGECGLVISYRNVSPFVRTLRLIPRVLHLGIGCKRGTSAEGIEAAVCAALDGAGICRDAVKGVASIDVKRDEDGLRAFCGSGNLPVRFFSAEELMEVPGEFTASAFVKSVVGVDNVCERAALCAAGENARLIIKKTCLNGVTVAVAQEEWSVCFE